MGFDDAFGGVFGDIFSLAHCTSGMDFVLGLCEGVVGAGFIPLSHCVFPVAFAVVLRGDEYFAIEVRGGVVGMLFLEGVFLELDCFLSVLGGVVGAFCEGTLWRGGREVVDFRSSGCWSSDATAVVTLVAVAVAVAAVTRVFFTARGAAVSGVCVLIARLFNCSVGTSDTVFPRAWCNMLASSQRIFDGRHTTLGSTAVSSV